MQNNEMMFLSARFVKMGIHCGNLYKNDVFDGDVFDACCLRSEFLMFALG